MYLIVFILGLFFGSFYNVCIYRLPTQTSIVFPPSKCSACEHKLSALDLIPVLSYVILKGKCRYCQAKISIQYPIIEIFTGILFVWMYHHFGLNLFFLKAITLASIILIMTVIDFRHYIIPDGLSLVTVISGVLFFILIGSPSFKSILLGFLIGGIALFLIALIGPMGGGDIKIMAGFGLYLGYPKVIMALLLSFIVGGIISIFLLLLKIKSRKDMIPFGPFLGIGTLITFLYYQEIMLFYLNILF